MKLSIVRQSWFLPVVWLMWSAWLKSVPKMLIFSFISPQWKFIWIPPQKGIIFSKNTFYTLDFYQVNCKINACNKSNHYYASYIIQHIINYISEANTFFKFHASHWQYEYSKVPYKEVVFQIITGSKLQNASKNQSHLFLRACLTTLAQTLCPLQFTHPNGHLNPCIPVT